MCSAPSVTSNRPAGTSVLTGPATELWSAVGEYDVVDSFIVDYNVGDGNVVHDTLPLGPNTGLEPIRYRPIVLDDPYFGARLENWLVTLRKMNCVVVMMTQYPGQLREARVGKTIVETVPTQILFPNDRATPADYDVLRVEDRVVVGDDAMDAFKLDDRCRQRLAGQIVVPIGLESGSRSREQPGGGVSGELRDVAAAKRDDAKRRERR